MTNGLLHITLFDFIDVYCLFGIECEENFCYFTYKLYHRQYCLIIVLMHMTPLGKVQGWQPFLLDTNLRLYGDI
jgi:hypothetical protein